jgi:RNA polymerase sigma-70 factor (ECF subfamily)
MVVGQPLFIHSAEAERTAGESFHAEDAAEVHRALDHLEPRHREVLIRFFLEHFSLKEIAAVVGCAEGTVKSRLYCAKQAMRELLKGKYA